ncbi:hypothetical protein FA10DRAFT_292001 [Acaromyces ingoldii]|uniref:Transketolase-like pyrimidine-binding domain-containing protein n=1 Tax=Acaromyces ingoldii TaxID=215250 RepID=A0A316YFE2_9BASI|nr:hypothetical protein FA10DRAFT_292001 [Acaromyces ingoldii]PWN86455.1 hypothetical protein FA10DRAFT_292001 [Acaromyces ingoldii]
MDMLKLYHTQGFLHSQAAGHPEIEFEGIEVTTGSLGQGFASAASLAMASKHLGDKVNVEGFEIVNNKVWCMTGDGYLREGRATLSLAGHLRLNRLSISYDNNGVSIDSKIDTCFTEDTSAKLLALEWHVIDVGHDATDDPIAIQKAMQEGKASVADKLIFINTSTTNGIMSESAGLPAAHGSALGDAEVERVKKAHKQDPSQKYVLDERVYDSFKPISASMAVAMSTALLSSLPSKSFRRSEFATRKASGIVIAKQGLMLPQFMAESADLMDSTFVAWSKVLSMTFRSPDLSKSGEDGSFAGRQINYGIRELAMVVVANGLTTYHTNAILPVVSTFFMFLLYAAPAVRMAALQRLRVLLLPPNRIGINEDAPNYRPIALASFFCAMSGINYLRPADAEEVMGAWTTAVQANVPSLLSLSRQAMLLLEQTSREGGMPNLILISTGSEVHLAIEVASVLTSDACVTRVISTPCQALFFDQQSAEYKLEVLPMTAGALVVATEAWSSFGWAKYAHASVGMHSYGTSASADLLYEHFGCELESIAIRVRKSRQRHTKNGSVMVPAVDKFKELLL